MRGTKDRINGDEHILGAGNSLQEVLESCREQPERRCPYQAEGME